MENGFKLGPFEEFDLWLEALNLHLRRKRVVEEPDVVDYANTRREELKITLQVLRILTAQTPEALETQLQETEPRKSEDFFDGSERLRRQLEIQSPAAPQIVEVLRLRKVLRHYHALCHGLARNRLVTQEQCEAIRFLVGNQISQFKSSQSRNDFRQRLYSSQISYIIDRHLMADIELSGVREQLQLILSCFLELLSTLGYIQQELRRSLQPDTLLLLVNCTYFGSKNLIRVLDDSKTYLRNFKQEWANALFATGAGLKLETRRIFSEGLQELEAARLRGEAALQAEELVGFLDHACRESFTALARALNPHFEETELFPELNRRHQESVLVRDRVRALYELTLSNKQELEQTWQTVRLEMEDFKQTCLQFLFARDYQPFSRFVEELRGEQSEPSDVLHRLEVYLSTLLGEIQKRAIFGKFEEKSSGPSLRVING